MKLTFVAHMPVHARVGDEVLEPFELTGDERTVGFDRASVLGIGAETYVSVQRLTPGTCVADIEVIPPFLRRILRASFLRDEVAER